MPCTDGTGINVCSIEEPIGAKCYREWQFQVRKLWKH